MSWMNPDERIGEGIYSVRAKFPDGKLVAFFGYDMVAARSRMIDKVKKLGLQDTHVPDTKYSSETLVVLEIVPKTTGELEDDTE